MAGEHLADQGEAVEVEPWCRWVWRAWHDLTADRHWRGGGMGPASPCRIPYSAMRSWADDNGQDLRTLKILIRAMDDVFIEHWAELVRDAASNSSDTSNGPNRGVARAED